MGLRVYYEWDFESVDCDGNIVDHNHFDKLDPGTIDLKDDLPGDIRYRSLVLVRDVWRDDGELVDRTWAYVRNGKLPEFTQCAYQTDQHKVPKRFHTALAKCTILNEPTPEERDAG